MDQRHTEAATQAARVRSKRRYQGNGSLPDYVRKAALTLVEQASGRRRAACRAP